ncbi:MAG: leucine-rich repeat domain-containing protein [Treponema sp.]|nr:leucine-rich repeat domain-containing protein [Treponema sp.]
MKKTHGLWFGFAVLFGAAMFIGGCETGGGGATVSYSGTTGGKTYTLVIYESGDRAAYTPQSGDRYELTISPDNTRSVGTVAASTGTTLTLKPSNATASFTVAVKTTGTEGGSGEIASISGNVTFEDGKTQPVSVTISTGGGGGGGGGGGSGGNTGGSKIEIGDTPDEDGTPVYTGDFSFPLPSVAAARAYLAHLAKNNDPRGGVDDPILLPMKMNLGSRADSLAKFLAVIAAAGKYVDVDLSLCSMTGTVFDPDWEFSTGKDRVVSLILPDAAKSIVGGAIPPNLTNPAFKNFTSLQSISGSGIETIGASAFFMCDTLTTVDFPAATYIDKWAFASCIALTTVDFPAATHIGDVAFHYCKALTTVNLPAATYIGTEAFSSNYALVSLDLSAATFIGQLAFYACYDLTTLNLPEVTTLAIQALDLCPALTTLYLPKATDIGPHALSGCSALTTLDLPSATHIEYSAFSNCRALTTLNLPAVTYIGQAFEGSGDQALTITLPKDAPTIDLGDYPEYQNDYSKTVTVKRPAGSTYDPLWETDFKGAFGTSVNVTLVFEDL